MLNEENISEFLKANSIKPSYQRLKIYQYLIDKKNHPSVDMIFKELVHKIPTLSRTTVYNTLKLFIEKNITSLLTIKENEARFDADVSLHGHFLCTKCGTIYDIAIDKEFLKHEIFSHANINEHHIYFKGECNGYCDEHNEFNNICSNN